MSNRCLHLTQDGDSARLAIMSDAEVREWATTAVGKRYRVSPIFPVIPNEGRTPAAEEIYFVGFFLF
jgi:hypothetical protein